jgi:hypothetical protein
VMRRLNAARAAKRGTTANTASEPSGTSTGAGRYTGGVVVQSVGDQLLYKYSTTSTVPSVRLYHLVQVVLD